MNTSFFSSNSLKRIFFDSGAKFFSWVSILSKTKTACFIIVAFVSFLIAACNGKTDTGTPKKTDPAVQQNTQSGEGPGMYENHEGIGRDNRHMDSTYRGMDSMGRGMGPGNRKMGPGMHGMGPGNHGMMDTTHRRN